MKTIKSIETDKRYTNDELFSFLSANPLCAGAPQIVDSPKGERIIFPETQDGTYVVSVKCAKKINVYLGEYVPRAFNDNYYSDITYWGDRKKRKNLHEKIAQVAEELTRLLLGTDEDE